MRLALNRGFPRALCRCPRRECGTRPGPELAELHRLLRGDRADVPGRRRGLRPAVQARVEGVDVDRARLVLRTVRRRRSPCLLRARLEPPPGRDRRHRAFDDEPRGRLCGAGFQDPQAALDLRRSVGYCRRHLAQLAERQDPFASAVLADASVEGALLQLEEHPRPFGRGRRHARTHCPVCTSLVSLQQTASGCSASSPRPTRPSPTSTGARTASATTITGRLHDVRRLKKSFDYRSDAPSPELARAWRRAFRALRDDPGRLPC